MHEGGSREGFQIFWIGLYLDNRNFAVGLTIERAMWLAKGIDDAIRATLIQTREFAGVLGRMNFAASQRYVSRLRVRFTPCGSQEK